MRRSYGLEHAREPAVPAVTGGDDQDQPGMSFEHVRQQPQAAFATEVDGQPIEIDHYQLASAIALLLLRDAGGVLRMPSSVWNRARDAVESAAPFGLASDWLQEKDWLLFHLHERPRVQILDIRVQDDGEVSGTAVEPPPTRSGISGDAEVDRHIAIVRAVLGMREGRLECALSHFVLAAYDVQEKHAWRVIVESDGEDTLIHLIQPHTPPHVQLLGPAAGQ